MVKQFVQSNQELINISKILSQQIRDRVYKTLGTCVVYHYLERAGFSFDLSEHLENPEHHPRVMEWILQHPRIIG